MRETQDRRVFLVTQFFWKDVVCLLLCRAFQERLSRHGMVAFCARPLVSGGFVQRSIEGGGAALWAFDRGDGHAENKTLFEWRSKRGRCQYFI